MKTKVNLIVKGNLIAKTIDESTPHRRGGISTGSTTIVNTDDLSNFDVSGAVVIEGDINVSKFYYNGIVVVTGQVVSLGESDNNNKTNENEKSINFGISDNVDELREQLKQTRRNGGDYVY